MERRARRQPDDFVGHLQEISHLVARPASRPVHPAGGRRSAGLDKLLTLLHRAWSEALRRTCKIFSISAWTTPSRFFSSTP